MTLSQEAPKILVTGTTGPSGTAIALELVRAGFSVRGTSRSSTRAKEWSAKYPNAKVEWVLIDDHEKAEEGTYDKAVVGCDGVIHSVGPFTLNHAAGQDIMIRQTWGTKSILTACAKEPKVKRLVYTSTIAAVNNDPHLDTGLGQTFTEADWNPTSWEKGADSTATMWEATSYCAGKTIAEKMAWEFMEKNKPGFDLVVLCPATVFGALGQVLNTFDDLDTASERLWHHILEAKNHMPKDLSNIFADIQDVAEAHLKALTWPKCGGERYMICSGAYSYARVFSILRKAFPEQADKFPVIENEGLPVKARFINDVSKAERELGMRWRTLEESIIAEGKVLFDLEKISKA